MAEEQGLNYTIRFIPDFTAIEEAIKEITTMLQSSIEKAIREAKDSVETDTWKDDPWDKRYDDDEPEPTPIEEEVNETVEKVAKDDSFLGRARRWGSRKLKRGAATGMSRGIRELMDGKEEPMRNYEQGTFEPSTLDQFLSPVDNMGTLDPFDVLRNEHERPSPYSVIERGLTPEPGIERMMPSDVMTTPSPFALTPVEPLETAFDRTIGTAEQMNVTAPSGEARTDEGISSDVFGILNEVTELIGEFNLTKKEEGQRSADYARVADTGREQEGLYDRMSLIIAELGKMSESKSNTTDIEPRLGDIKSMLVEILERVEEIPTVRKGANMTYIESIEQENNRLFGGTD